MGRPDTLGGLIRKERLLTVTLGAFAALATLGGFFDLRWLVILGVIVALAGAGVRIWLAVRQNRLGADLDKITLSRGLRVRVSRIAEINPNDIGIDRAEQEILPGGGLPEYVPRHIDNEGPTPFACGRKSSLRVQVQRLEPTFGTPATDRPRKIVPPE